MDTSHKFPASVRILVVDDHPGTAVTLARAISQIGPNVEVISATSGREALERVAGDSVDVLITDMMMPGMNGLELVEKMQANPGGRPAHIILITAYDVPGLKETARRLKVEETIIKPVRPERICQIVSNITRSIGPSPTHPMAETKTQPFKILIADDVPDNITLLSRYMQSDGYGYVTASNGQETLEKARTEMPDLVLLDVNMPDKDGFTVLEEIRADPTLMHIPVIILTAARMHPDDVQAGLNLGADDYITKPFDRRELFARIRAKLRTKAFEDTIRSRNRQLSMLPEIGKELSARLDLEELTNVVLRRTLEMLGALMGHIFLLDPRSPIQKSHYAPSLTGTRMGCPNMDAFLAEINESRNSLTINDIREEPRWQPISDDPTRSAVITPMFGRDHLLGLLVLTHEHTGYFQLEHLLLLQAITSQASIAMENALLYADLAHQQKRLSVVLHSTDEAIFMFDAEGCLSLNNPAGENLFAGFPTRLGHPLKRGQGYDPLVELLEQARQSTGLRSGEITWPDGRVFSVLVNSIENGGLVVVLHDVTTFKRVEQVKNEFIATASHDLKNPLTTIAGFSVLIGQAGPLNEQQMDFISRIQSAAQTMTELVQNMMALAQMDLEPAKHEAVDLVDLLNSIAKEFSPQATAREQKLSFQLPATAHTSGDTLQLKQLFRNLLGNAIKYTPKGGCIQVDAKVDNDTVLVNVRDNGCGIPAADLPFVFDRFYRVHMNGSESVEGNGLGLAIVKSIVEQHGGQISVESEVGKGTCFSVSLPFLAEKTLYSDPIDFSNQIGGAPSKGN